MHFILTWSRLGLLCIIFGQIFTELLSLIDIQNWPNSYMYLYWEDVCCDFRQIIAELLSLDEVRISFRIIFW